MYVALRLYGAPNPTQKQWLGATAVGILLPVLGNGTVTYVQLSITSSVAALSIATVPIWMAIISSIWGHKIVTREWLGIVVGFVGIAILNFGGTFSTPNGDVTSEYAITGHANYFSALLLIFAAASWSFGSVWGKQLAKKQAMPAGLMGAACQMLMGGFVMLLVSWLHGDSWPNSISNKSWGALLFLIVPGSLMAYSAYQYLLKTVRPLVASSNTFVNPIVAFAVGMAFAGETITKTEYAALAVILVGVYLVLTANNENTT